MTKLEWQWKQFQDITVFELHELLKLRQDVFVVEQNCVYADIDDADKTAWHLLGAREQTLVACARVIPPSRQDKVAIGRVITNQEFRGQGIGKIVMQQSIEFVEQKYPKAAIKISAQQHLEPFYTTFGFVKTSEPYDDCGIMHIDMLFDQQKH